MFGLDLDKIKVVVHPQSIIHSMVEYIDGSVIAQLGSPDMRLPIQFALTYPERKHNNFSKLDLLKCGCLTFEEPDMKSFPCLKLAFEALRIGSTMPAVMNAANEEAVGLFLKEKIKFVDIPNAIEKVMSKHAIVNNPTIEDILEVDLWARQIINKMYI